MTTSLFKVCLPLVCWVICVPSIAWAAGESHGFDWRVNGFYIFDFLLLVWILVKYGGEPLSQFLTNRRQSIMAEIDTAQQLQGEAEQKLAEAEVRLAELEAEKQRIRAEFVEAGRRERDRLIAEATAASAKIAADAENRISQETKQLIASLEREAVDQAVAIALETASARLDATKQTRLVSAVVDAFETQTAA